MNAIERIKILLVSLLIFSSAIITLNVFIDFIENQNLDNYFITEDVYNFSDEYYLVEKELNICGKKYVPGSVINKKTYDYCKK